MVESRNGGSAAAAIDIDPRVPSGSCRRRTALVHFAAALLLLAPLACKREEPPDEPVAEPTTDEVASEEATLGGSWHSTGPGVCTELGFDLIAPVPGKNGSVFYPSPDDEGIQLTDVNTLPGGGLAGGAPSGGPYPDCREPSTTSFTATSAGTDLLDFHWVCTSVDGEEERTEYTRYERGPCPAVGSTPGEVGGDNGSLVTTPGEDGFTQTPPDDGTADTTTPQGKEEDASLMYTSMDGKGDTLTTTPQDESEGSARCPQGEYHLQYAAPSEACGPCEDSCRETCAQQGSTLLGDCRVCDVAPDLGDCGQCMKSCLGV